MTRFVNSGILTQESDNPMRMQKTRGKNLIYVGFENGTLRAMFKHGQYDYSGVPEVEFLKLLKVPFPDKLFVTNIKGKYPVKKVGE